MMTGAIACLAALILQATSGQEPRRVTPDQQPKPAYRELKAGEEATEGLLQRVECPAGRPVTFVMKVKDRPEKFEASRLGDVEYIAHTPNFKGPMSCGGRGAGDPVRVSWEKAGTVRRVVAIEFLPRK
jgi:hypothetical protein